MHSLQYRAPPQTLQENAVSGGAGDPEAMEQNTQVRVAPKLAFLLPSPLP